MTDRPILFSAPMVLALLEGRKTQMRRVLDAYCDEPPAYVLNGVITAEDENDRPYRWPRTHAVGDRLWVRETWAPLSELTHNDPGCYALAWGGFYRADEGTVPGEIGRWRPSIHMPRWASRFTLVVTDVRVQRLHDISEEDAKAEGVTPVLGVDGVPLDRHWVAYNQLWDAIHGPASWIYNPFVAAYSFTVHHCNIDAMPAPTAAAAE